MFAVKKAYVMHMCINSDQFQITSFATHNISYLSDELVIDFEWLGLWFSLKMVLKLYKEWLNLQSTWLKLDCKFQILQ